MPGKKNQIFTYQNLPVAYQTTGSGPAILFLHGWGSSSDVMYPLAEQMSARHTCYLIDFPGFGQSPAPDSAWGVDQYTDLIESFIREKKLEGCGVLAHSFGGRVVLKLMARKKGNSIVGKVLITGGAGMKPKRKPAFYLKKYTAKVLKAPFMILPAKLRDKGLTSLRKTGLWKSLGSSDYRSLDSVMREIFVKTVNEFLENCLPDVQNDVLLLWGSNDETTPIYQAKRMEKGLNKAALVTIENAGHYAFLDQPHRFFLISEAFFK